MWKFDLYVCAVRFIFVRFDLFFAVLFRFICACLILDELVLKILSVTERHTQEKRRAAAFCTR